MESISLVAATVLPLWNIPLILRIQKRRSSGDVSLLWALGVWGSFLLMLPAGLTSVDQVFRVFTISNIILFTAVVVQVIRYRR